MENAIKKLEELGLKYRESDSPERRAIDFAIENEEDNVAWVWGDRHDLDWECHHPEVEYGDDDERGQCVLCGSFCDWNYEKEWLDEGHDEDGGCVGKEIEVRRPHTWYPRRAAGGLLKELIEGQEL